MKNKLTKEQIKVRKEKFNKFCRIFLYVSLALNALLIGLFCFGCSKSVSHDYTTKLTKQYRQVNNATENDFNIYNNSSVICYDLTSFEYNGTFTGSTNGTVNLSTNQNIMLFSSSPEQDFSGIDTISFNSTVHSPLQSGDHIQIAGVHISTNQVIGGSNIDYYNNEWHISFNGSAADGFCLALNLSYLNNITQVGLNAFLEAFYPLVPYTDYALATNWSPYGYFNNTYCVYKGQKSGDEEILKKTLFSINGQVYDTMVVTWTNNVTPNNGYLEIGVLYDGEIIHLADNTAYSWVVGVSAINRSSGLRTPLMVLPPATQDGVDLVLHVQELRFRDYSRSNVRLFAVNLDISVIGDYKNGNSLAMEYNFPSGSGSGQFGNVFNLFLDAFRGLEGLFTIMVLPGLTIGMLLFLPLIGIIVFAIIRLIKK